MCLEKCPNCRTVVKHLPPKSKAEEIFMHICHQKKPCKGVLYLCSSNKRNLFQKQIVFLLACNMDMVNNQPTPLGHIFKACANCSSSWAFMSCIHIQNETLQELMTNFILENQIVGFIWFIMSMTNKWIHENRVPTLWEWKHTDSGWTYNWKFFFSTWRGYYTMAEFWSRWFLYDENFYSGSAAPSF